MGFDTLRVRPGRGVRLGQVEPTDTSAFSGGKRRATAELPARLTELDRLQELLYVDGRFALLIVLQGMDTAGKDGTIRHVFEGVNPQGVRVSAFRAPTPSELAHDFLWRVHAETPPKGHIGIFNRSHYEDVVAARVHHVVPRGTVATRYRSINHFERELVDEGTSVLKFFLHISKEEQRRRLRERIADPTKRWKLSASDLTERSFWTDYMRRYEEMLRRTSTPWAPWFVVPSDKKWYRNLVVSSLIVEHLRALGLRYPPAGAGVSKLKLT